ncbi:CCA tRNA nucleotidyltransferase [Limimonas halophila]|uniref:CCA tRNA nucleotidyltransferase n=1 Tax=Limimonas halophila TaxID=1082479 RepID=UPI001C40B8B0|nr:CCA tRNA nucleotidyltransferase [Limimonas halophila]
MSAIPLQPWMTAAATRAVLDALEADGRAVRFVGGCVRDAVLGRPVNDVDIATPDAPETVMELLRRAGIKVVPTGIDHGTVTAVVDGAHFEITTLRRDVETHGRRATVAFTDDWTADAARRDFTINAMSCAPDGTLFDPFGGYDDLMAGRVVFVGNPDRRIREDYLRLLRFFRFHARYGRGAPDALGLHAATVYARRLADLSGERIRDELLKLLLTPRAAATVTVMTAHCILDAVLPEATRADRLRALIAREGASGVSGGRLRRLAALLATDAAGAETAAERLRLSRRERKRLTELVEPPVPAAADMPGRELRAALYRRGADEVRDLVLLDAADRDVASTGPAQAALRDALAAIDAWEPRKLPVTGADAKAAGVPPGPRVGEVMRWVEAWWLDHDMTPDRDACLAKLQEVAATDRAAEQ